MNVFGKVTWKAMWKNRVRTLVTIAGVILSAAMFTAVTTMAASLMQFLIDVEVYEEGSHFISYDIADDAVGEALRADGDVDELGDYQALGYVCLGEALSSNYYIMSAVEENVFDLAGIHAAEGRLPENSSEVLLPERVVSRLEELGLPHAVGDTVTLEILPAYIDEEVGLPSGTETATKHYTIVGIAEGGLYIGAQWNYIPSIITLSDGTQPALWHRYFATTSDPKAVYDVEQYIDAEADLHYDLLNFYRASRYTNYNTMMTNLVLVLIAIIMVGSVSLIYNAFSISVAERTKQFGLLSSIGATKRQLRRSVFFEAGVLCLMGIPLGLLFGWGGIAVTLHFVGDMFGNMLMTGAGEAGITLRAIVSPVALLAAALTGILTVFVSAWIPARRATRVSPMAAIRQSGDYQVTKKQVRVSRLSYKLWGLPGVLAKKYYSVSRKKYRATVISLAISVLLFITASSYANVLRQGVELSVRTENYDIMASWLEETEVEALRSRDDVAQSVVVRPDTSSYALVTDEMMSQEHLQWLEESFPVESGFNAHCRRLYIYYLEDAALEAYLTEHKIDPAPYFDPEAPMALVCNKEITGYSYDAETGEYARYTTTFSPFTADATALELVDGMVPEELSQSLPGEEYVADYVTEEGKIFLRMTPWIFDDVSGYREDLDGVVWFEVVREAGVQAYYAYDMDTGARAIEATCTVDASDTLQSIRLGAAISELPFGISSMALSESSSLYVILPLSAAKGEPQYGIDMALKASGYETLKAWLDDNEIPYSDELRDEMQARNIILLVNVFSYGFIILIALICVCNVFNTISTNIALRRRDFGMLRSVGLKTRELYRMMNFECLRYGVKALMAGLPLSLLCSYGIHSLTYSIADQSWQPPWLALTVAAGCIFLVVFATMLYAVSRLRKDNPIDAIRMENL